MLQRNSKQTDMHRETTLLFMKMRQLRDQIAARMIASEYLKFTIHLNHHLLLSQEPVPMKVVISHLSSFGISERTARKHLKTIEGAGYIKIEKSPHDARVQMVSPTKKSWDHTLEITKVMLSELNSLGITVSFTGNIPCYFTDDS